MCWLRLINRVLLGTRASFLTVPRRIAHSACAAHHRRRGVPPTRRAQEATLGLPVSWLATLHDGGQTIPEGGQTVEEMALVAAQGFQFIEGGSRM